MWQNNFMKNIVEVAKNTSDSTDKMMTAVDLWLNLYYDNAPWLGEDDSSLGLPSMIAAEFARSVTLEMEISVHGDKMVTFIDE